MPSFEWIWYGRDEYEREHVSFGRWQSHSCQLRYKLADVQPTEHDCPPRHPSADPRPAAQPGVVKGLHGPYGWLNGCRGLSEDSWTLESDPLENSEEYFAIPLYAFVDPFTEAGKDFQRPSDSGAIERAPVTDEELGQWAALRADDAGRLARELLAYRRLAALAAPVSQEPVDAERIAEVIAEESANEVACGWKACSGCHETNEGYETGDYPYSEIFGCHVGSPQPLTEGEPSEAEVEAARQIILDDVGVWLSSDTLRAALLSAKSKGGQADG